MSNGIIPENYNKKELVLAAATMGHLPAIIEMRHILEGEKPSKKWYKSELWQSSL